MGSCIWGGISLHCQSTVRLMLLYKELRPNNHLNTSRQTISSPRPGAVQVMGSVSWLRLTQEVSRQLSFVGDRGPGFQEGPGNRAFSGS